MDEAECVDEGGELEGEELDELGELDELDELELDDEPEGATNPTAAGSARNATSGNDLIAASPIMYGGLLPPVSIPTIAPRHVLPPSDTVPALKLSGFRA